MKQTVFSATQNALPKPIVCAKPKAPATDAPLKFAPVPIMHAKL